MRGKDGNDNSMGSFESNEFLPIGGDDSIAHIEMLVHKQLSPFEFSQDQADRQIDSMFGSLETLLGPDLQDPLQFLDMEDQYSMLSREDSVFRESMQEKLHSPTEHSGRTGWCDAPQCQADDQDSGASGQISDESDGTLWSEEEHGNPRLYAEADHYASNTEDCRSINVGLRVRMSSKISRMARAYKRIQLLTEDISGSGNQNMMPLQGTKHVPWFTRDAETIAATDPQQIFEEFLERYTVDLETTADRLEKAISKCTSRLQALKAQPVKEEKQEQSEQVQKKQSSEVKAETEATSIAQEAKAALKQHLKERLTPTQIAELAKEVVDQKKRQELLKPHARAMMKQWMLQHITYPYLPADERDRLADSLGITGEQVSTWFTNARKRHWHRLFPSGTDIPAKASEIAHELENIHGSLDNARAVLKQYVGA